MVFFVQQLELRDWTSVEFYQPRIDSLDRDNIGILAKFRPRKSSFDDSSIFCVASTHLLFNPRRHDVKLAQVALLLAGETLCFGRKYSNTPLHLFLCSM